MLIFAIRCVAFLVSRWELLLQPPLAFTHSAQIQCMGRAISRAQREGGRGAFALQGVYVSSCGEMNGCAA